jgi:hypothetical protein
MHVGKMNPNQIVKVHMVIVEQAEMFAAAYAFRLSESFYPTYAKHKAGSGTGSFTGVRSYTFSFKGTLVAPPGQKINYVSVPRTAQTFPDKSHKLVSVNIAKTKDPPRQSLNIFYKT